jgi:hypothetical protein
MEQGVSVQLCLYALPVFTEMNQWTLVARVMEFIVDDDMKRQVMQRAMESREGSVVWRCLSTMQHYRPSVDERKKLFLLAMDRGMWQLVKPLVEKKDRTGIRHRDTALLKAIEQRQWDVVDYCQLYDADIDMNDVHKETPLNREARKREWKAVDELVVRGADPNLLDKDGCSVINGAINQDQWGTVKLLIEYLANIHKEASSLTRLGGLLQTPLQFLITKRQAELIHHTLMWCPDQAKGINDHGETTLHAIVSDSTIKEQPKISLLLYKQVVRGVNPLQPAIGGYSVLLNAVKNSSCPQRMVGECIKLGFSTYQPELTQQSADDIALWLRQFTESCTSYTTSPLLLAVVRGLHVVAHMLYESGSCSPAELLQLYDKLLELTDPDTDSGRKLLKSTTFYDVESRQLRYKEMIKNIVTFLPYLKEMVSTPRSLVSTCRLIISRCLTVRRRRERAVHQLSLPVRSTSGELVSDTLPLQEELKNYLLFSDLTDPDYAYGRLPGTLPPLPPKETKER